MNFSDPKFRKTFMHGVVLVVLTAVSACIGPLYAEVVRAVTNSTPNLPLLLQELLPTLLPLVAALVVKFQDEVKKQLEREKNTVVAKNLTLLRAQYSNLDAEKSLLENKNVDLNSKNYVLKGENTLMAKTLATGMTPSVKPRWQVDLGNLDGPTVVSDKSNLESNTNMTTPCHIHVTDAPPDTIV